jgi:hypothetical protein
MAMPLAHAVPTSLPEIEIMLATRILATATTLIGVLLSAATVLPAPVLAEESWRPQTAESRRALSIPQIYDKLIALGYWNVDKIERESAGYEVRASDRSGDRVKLTLDAQTGEIVLRRVDKRVDKYRHRTDERIDERRGASADCNERRCRDDRPVNGTAVMPGA